MSPLLPQLLPSHLIGPRGLSNSEASRLLASEGYNELPRAQRQRMLRLLAELLHEPMVFLLIGCGLIYLVLGDKQEAIMLLGFLGVILGITLFQQQKAEHALEALRDLASPRALVLRDGRKVRIAGREVVRGDVLYLTEGDRIPADAVIISTLHCSVDESLLTGESQPVVKVDSAAMLYAGTTLVKGAAVARATATGPHTELGKIGGLLQEARPKPTRLEGETRRLVKIISIFSTVLCLLVVTAYVFYRHTWTQGLLAGLTLAMAILPNELPAVLTIFMALGAWRMSKQRVLTRRLSAIEALGTTTVLCVDKTGTLTYNRMALRRLILGSRVHDLLEQSDLPLPEDFHELLEFSLLASEQDAYDPMDHALKDAADQMLSGTEHLHHDWTVAKQYPISPKLLSISQAWHSIGGRLCPVAAKGAPEAIFDLCHLPQDQRKELGKIVATHASQGLRLLAVARGVTPIDHLAEKQHDIDFDYLGLVALEDPLRAQVPSAIAECQAAGIRVIMITGDHPHTAESIAKQAGLANPEDILTGTELDSLSEPELADRLRTVSVCARIAPEQKGRLVDALKARGEVVAMTGDGINDAPALSKANIGIAMGQRGSDVAREAATLVLLDDDFGSIVAAVKMGRRIYANLQHAMSYLLAVHIPIAGLSVIPVLFDLPLVLMPIHIAFLHLIIEPACSVAFEAESEAADTMRRPPRDSHEPLFSRAVIMPTLVQGGSMLVTLLAVFLIAWRWGDGEADARSIAFTVLVIANLGLIIASLAGDAPKFWRRKQANVALRWVVGGSLSMLTVVLYLGPVRTLFRFTVLHPTDLTICLVSGVLSSLWFLVVRKKKLIPATARVTTGAAQ